MNNEETKQKLVELKAAIEAIERGMKEPEVEGMNLLKFPDTLCFYYLGTDLSKGFKAGETSHEAGHENGNVFQTREIAEAYAEALNTLLLLRHQPKTVKAEDGIAQYVICPKDNGQGLGVEIYTWIDTKIEMIVPMFSTQRHAQHAIEKIGAEKIIRMFKTLHGIYE